MMKHIHTIIKINEGRNGGNFMKQAEVLSSESVSPFFHKLFNVYSLEICYIYTYDITI